jgi:Zn-dependent peptidase ImmA (M78 family)
MAGDVSVATKMGASLQTGAAEFRRYLRNRSVHTVGPSVGRLLAKELGEGFALHFGGRPPINPLDVARQIDIEVRFGPARASGQLGQVETRIGGFVITLYGEQDYGPANILGGGFERTHPELSRRARFTLAHELAHTFFFEEPNPHSHPARIVPTPTTRTEHWREEGLCNEFASSLLIPSYCQSLISREASFSAVIAATEAFRVSREAFLRRALYDWNIWPNFLAANISVGHKKPIRALLMGKHARGTTKDWKSARKRIQVKAMSATTTNDLSFSELESVGFRCEMVTRKQEVWLFVSG